MIIEFVGSGNSASLLRYVLLVAVMFPTLMSETSKSNELLI